ncbi:MAG: glycosyltransferase [Candidatus Sericytochromatia bacterium]|nr:glycosyltransferase [Candidatus Sericytochromatia bacterium]
MFKIITIYNQEIKFISLDILGNIEIIKILNSSYIYFSDILNLAPDKFKANIIVFWHPEYYFVPIGIENTDIFSICCVGDWNINFINLHASIRQFDHIITDQKGINAFKKYNFNNLSYFPLFSLRIPNYTNINLIKKYDILFIGNINQNVQTERSKYLYRIAKLSEKYNVLITSGIYGDEYQKTLSESKIIFNRSVRSEINARVFETLKAKSLLFLEEENLESEYYLKPNYNFVTYNEHNLENLIDFYLENDHKREEIVNNGGKFIEEYSTEKFNQDFYLHIIKIYQNKVKNNNPFMNYSEEQKLNVYYTQAIMTLDKSVLTKVKKIFPLNNNSAEIVNIFAITLYNEKDYNTLFYYLKNVVKEFPKHLPLKINYLNTLLELNLLEKAEIFIIKSIEIINIEVFNLDDLKGVFIKEIYTRFQIELENVFSSDIDNNLIESIKNIYLWKFYFEMGNIKRIQKDNTQAEYYYTLADKLMTSSITKNILGNLCEELGQLSEAYKMYIQAFKDDLFNSKNLNDLISLEIKTDYTLEESINRKWMTIMDSSPLYDTNFIAKKLYQNENIKHKLALINKHKEDKILVSNLAKKILEMDSLNYQALSDLGDIYYSENEYKKSLDLFSKCLNIKKDRQIIEKIINCLKELGDTETLRKIIY